MANALSILLTIATLQFSLTTANVSIVSVCDGAHICDCVCVSVISQILIPVVPPPGGSLEMTPGKRKHRKSKPNL